MNNIKTIINEWNPVDLFPFAPEDEYRNEIEEVAKILKEDIGTEELAMKIKSVFTDSFGKDMFFKDDKSNLEIAKKLKELVK